MKEEKIYYSDALNRIDENHDTYNSRTIDNRGGPSLFVEGDHIVAYSCCLVDYNSGKKTIATGKSLRFECNITKGTLYNACCVVGGDMLFRGTLDECIEFFNKHREDEDV